MIEGIIYGLIGAWFLSLFGVDNIFVEALQPFVNFTLTKIGRASCRERV